MALAPRTGFGRFLLLVIIVTTISYLVLNLVSFGGTSWITYTDVPIRFGLWRVCDTTTSGLCNQWADNSFKSNITSNTFPAGKPSFIQSSQALEIISLIFYIFAAFLIIIGIIDLDGLPFEIMFLAAAVLLFISIVFISATLGVMSVQGRSNHSGAFLDWAWWNGLVGLIMTIICFISLIAFVMDMRLSPSNHRKSKMKRSKRKKEVHAPSIPPWTTTTTTAEIRPPFVPPSVVPTRFVPPPIYSPPIQPTNQLTSPPMNYPYNQGMNDYNLNNYTGNIPIQYGNVYPWIDNKINQTPSPLISALAQDYVLRAYDNQYQTDLLMPYEQYNQQPFLINTYI
ncbi:unnamed protein product [Rotaria sp. Silwood1]|nr:unnamed protein product [Rotaria sp. Silwood1]CAF3656353.1 unnamed protein product [Rotaria sp. Silwood1]CAF5047981.1 unnamed protein product [Rotaria sp. Silwood1]